MNPTSPTIMSMNTKLSHTANTKPAIKYEQYCKQQTLLGLEVSYLENIHTQPNEHTIKHLTTNSQTEHAHTKYASNND